MSVNREFFGDHADSSDQLICRLWSGTEPPTCFRDWTALLSSEDEDRGLHQPIDEMFLINHEFATVRSKILRRGPSLEALSAINEIEQRLVQWASWASQLDKRWRYQDMRVADSAHVWNCSMHAYSQMPVPSVWNSYRCLRIIVSRAHEVLEEALIPNGIISSCESHRIAMRDAMVNDICASMPFQLDHGGPLFSSPSALATAYTSLWPLFHAGACAKDSLMKSGWTQTETNSGGYFDTAQFAWILGRLDYVSNVLGLRSADNLASVLRGGQKLNILGEDIDVLLSERLHVRLVGKCE